MIQTIEYLRRPGVSRGAVGKLLATGPTVAGRLLLDDFVAHLLRHRTLSTIEALRLLLQSLILPNSSKPLKAVMAALAAAYFIGGTERTHFGSVDDVYKWLWCLMLLHSDLHSARVKHKMSGRQFGEYAQAIAFSRPLSSDFIRRSY